ncbi:zinc finger, C3HC4 type [Ancylostoma duodenale]|uniref:Zinc finger, C3HC4 type n=1 Tax=Ancylostoma duodenale TaxID=51022 RepID=A0A0C2G4B8_9BILA|nr:zinc finger, C3HC4 type [Ancylostoma duodenale]
MTSQDGVPLQACIRYLTLNSPLPGCKYVALSTPVTPSSLCSMENQPLIVKEVDEEVKPKDDTKPSQNWLPSQLLGSDLATSKGSICSSSTALCRICHTECDSPRDPFVSPCRCSGSLLYVHRSCLVVGDFPGMDPLDHWLELSTRKMVPSPRCELCGYNYRRRNCINVSVSLCLVRTAVSPYQEMEYANVSFVSSCRG